MREFHARGNRPQNFSISLTTIDGRPTELRALELPGALRPAGEDRI
jgi:hypothetical protein